MKMAKKPNRQAELARIHIAKKELNMTDDDYRFMLHSVTGKSSAALLTAREAARTQGVPALVHLITSAEDIAPGRTISGMRKG
jgi:hypothetical protein